MMFLLIVTLSSMLLAAIMSLVAWRIAAEERRRSEARIAALAEEIHAPIAAASGVQQTAYRAESASRIEPARLAAFPSARRSPRWDDAMPDLPLRQDRIESSGLFAAAQPSGGGSRLAVAGIAAAIVGVAALAAVTMTGRRTTATAPSRTAVAARDNQGAAPAAQPAPLELVALGHQRDGDRLTVRGVVRNPAAGAALTGLTASVFVFDADGGFVTSGRAAIDERTLNPSGESTFAVVVPNATTVSRYRVSFRWGDRIVAHVDKREPLKKQP